ncbi:MAG TPA: EAL domain-containing protein [Microbacteriaceae bacterium]|nr:EAL domain-containing protein [Microbacteriaceae bacterium]
MFVRALSEGTADGILILGKDLEPIFYNERYLDLWGIDESLMQPGLGLERRKQISKLALNSDSFFEQMQNVVKNQIDPLRTEIVLHSGRIYDCHIVPIFDDASLYHGLLITYRDVTSHRMAEDQRNYLSRHDKTSGLLNRSTMFQVIESRINEIEGSTRTLGILTFDLTRYKRINNHHGHIVSDQVLSKIGSALQTSLSPHTLSRYGEDEFLLMVPSPDPNELLEVADTISQILKSIVIFGELDLELTACFGISFYPDHGSNATELVTNADIAMRHAQNLGSGSVVKYTEALGVAVAQRLDIESQLPLALERDCFRLLYQPLFDIETQKIVGSEALLRWHCDNRGNVPPNEFLPHAEESGLIIPIGEWVLRSACSQAAIWSRLDLGKIPVSVNVSAVQFSGSDFPNTVKEALEETGLDPQLLEIEFTETAFVENLSSVSKAIEKIRQLGVKVSIDDFGTGYSSLQYLRHFKVDTLKIDGSFTQGIGNTKTDNALVATAIDMAHNLGLSATAEGVESAEQLEFLRTNNCDLAQGFYFSQPLTADAFSDLVRNQV